jgi:glycosyltransferase involved in cell wall biosynthesis
MAGQDIILSIIICTYNREEFIGKTLEHIARQEIDSELYETIVVNNNSRDQTENICLDFINQHPELNLRHVTETHQGHSYARNRGIRESRGSLIAYIDDDAFVRKDFAANIIRFFEEHPEVQVIGGKVIPVYQGTPPAWMTPYLLPLVSALDMGNSPRPFTGRKFPIGANVTFRKAVFEKYGQFNVALGRIGMGLMGGDEKEMVSRLKKNDEPIWYVPDVVVEHIIPPKRTEQDYIQSLARGVGQSETRRLKDAPFVEKLKRAVEELVKIGGTFVLFFLYLLRGQAAKGSMLLRFRYWVIQGFLGAKA